MSVFTTSQAHAQVVIILDESVDVALRLAQTLADERRALESQDLAMLDDVVVRKSADAEFLKVLDGKREELLAACNLPSGPDRMQELIDWCDENDKINIRWQRLLQITADSSDVNITNGAIIRVRQQHFESSLAVLRGHRTGPETYGRNGEETHDFSRHSIATA